MAFQAVHMQPEDAALAADLAMLQAAQLPNDSEAARRAAFACCKSQVTANLQALVLQSGFVVEVLLP